MRRRMSKPIPTIVINVVEEEMALPHGDAKQQRPLRPQRPFSSRLRDLIIIALALSLCTFFPRAIIQDLETGGTRSTSYVFQRYAITSLADRNAGTLPYHHADMDTATILGSLCVISLAISSLAHVVAGYFMFARFDTRTALLFIIVPPVIAGINTFVTSGLIRTGIYGSRAGPLVASWLASLGWMDVAVCVGILFKGCVDMFEEAMDEEKWKGSARD
jgi:hypothetical protein